MNLHTEWKDKTTAILEVSVGEQELGAIKEKVIRRLAPTVKAAGFREGHVPPAVVEKQLGSNRLQAEVLDEALNAVYAAAVRQEGLRPAGRPEVDVTAFVPYTQLECAFTVDCIGEIKLGNYKTTKAKLSPAKVTAEDVKNVLDNLALRMAERNEVKRAAKTGDQVWIDFAGKDQKGKPIERADGKDYPLALGSNTFIPGFEENLVGLKSGDKKSFTVIFPKTYGVKDLQNRKVTFDVTVNKVEEVVKPKHDDAFAQKLGPFKTVAQLKEDVKKQLQFEKDETAQRDYEAAVVREITEKSSVAIPDSIVGEQIEAMIAEAKRDLVNRGMTWQEFLDSQGKSEDVYKKEQIEPAARERIKAGLILSQIAQDEKITVSAEELDERIAELKKQYQDEAMQKELDKVENQQDVAARILSEKTIKFLTKN